MQKKRKKNQKQMPLMIAAIDHSHAQELENISRILDDNPIISEMVWQDLTKSETFAEPRFGQNTSINRQLQLSYI